jgi:chromate transporter
MIRTGEAGIGTIADQPRAHGISFFEAMRTWARIAALSFGGPAGQIAVMHRILVEEKRWIGEARFLHTLNYCMLLPGPEAQQLAVYIGWLLHKTRGRLVAGTLFILAGLLAIMALSLIYAAFGSVGIVQALFFGLKAAVLAIVLEAVVRIGKRALKNRVMIGIAAAAFVAIFVLDASFPLVILAAGLLGFVGGRAGYPAFLAGGGGHGPGAGSVVADGDTALGEALPAHGRPGLAWSLKVASVCEHGQRRGRVRVASEHEKGIDDRSHGACSHAVVWPDAGGCTATSGKPQAAPGWSGPPWGGLPLALENSPGRLSQPGLDGHGRGEP